MKSDSISRGKGGITSVALSAALLLVWAVPLASIIIQAITGSHGELLVHMLRTVLPMQAGYSLLSATGAVFIGAALASGGALCGLFEFPGRRILQRTLLVPLLIPPWFIASIYQDRLGFSGAGALVVVLGISSAPLFQLFMTASLLDLPLQHLHVLQTTGHGSPARLVRHLLPLSFPAFAAAAVLVFLLAWGDGACPRILAVPTLAVGMYDQWFGRQQDSAGATVALALLAMSVLPALLLWALVARKGWSEGGRLQRGRMGRVRVSGIAALIPWVLSAPQMILGVLLPVLIIGAWSLDHIDRVNLVTIGQDMLRTLLLVFGGTLIAGSLAVAVLRDRIIRRAPGLTMLTSGIIIATFAIPPMVLALAVLWLLPGDVDCVLISFLTSTPLPLAASIGMRFCAIFLVAGEAALLRSARAHADVLRVYGRTGLLSFAHLFKPFLAGPLMAGACFVFLECLKDLSLSLILQPFGFTTLAMRLFQYSQTQRLHEGAVWVVCIALVGAYPLSVLARLADSERRTTLSRASKR